MGQEPLPADTLFQEIQSMCEELFAQIEQKKRQFEKIDKAYKV